MQQHTVLIIDDEPMNCRVMQAVLSKENHRVLTALSGRDGLRLLEEDKIDLVLLDVMMPDMDGFEVCRRIHNQPSTHEIPVLFVTALDDRDSRRRGLEAGALDFISKPLDVAEVRLRVRRVLQMREMYVEQRKFNQRHHQDLLEARKIQSKLLPPHNMKLPGGLQFQREYYPCEDLGGDFMDVMELDDDWRLLYLADVSGHGVASSLITIYVKERLLRMLPVVSPEDPAGVLSELNREFLEMDLGDRYLTLFVAFVHGPSRTVNWSIAGGNNPPFLLREDGVEELSTPAMAIGWFENAEWENRTCTMSSGDVLLLYSDAAIENGPAGEAMIGRKGLQKLVEAIGLRENPDLKVLINELLENAGALVFDDDLSLATLTAPKES